MPVCCDLRLLICSESTFWAQAGCGCAHNANVRNAVCTANRSLSMTRPLPQSANGYAAAASAAMLPGGTHRQRLIPGRRVVREPVTLDAHDAKALAARR